MSGLAAQRLLIAAAALLAAEAAAVGLDAALPPDLARAERSSPVALDRRGLWLRALPVENGRWRVRADLARTDPTFLRRVVAVEDARFFRHAGVDPLAVIRATGSAIAHGQARSGASTLTMQTARLLEPRPRNIGSKLIEMARAIQLEARYSKREILALYLTLAPYGGNLEGVRAASLSYFGHEPESLTPGEQALLIALPQAPEARRPDRRPEGARRARARVLTAMVRKGELTEPAAREGEDEPLPHRAAFPARAWHAAGELAKAAPAWEPSVVSTLDADLQARIEPLARAAAEGQGPQATAAILVVEVKTRAVRAAVGSAGLDRDGGWLDMTRALRSPGSTLKPFIYALAFEGGLAAPDTRIDDAPRRFVDYQPENFDRAFHGEVTAREALVHSLNMPAVTTLDRVGADRFQNRLEATGIRLARPKDTTREAGLAIALGGAGISLRDLALLYAALADDGVAKSLAWREVEALRRPAEPGVRLVSADAARQVLEILKETPVPLGRTPVALTRNRAAIAFKTGTSYGFRDALAAGVVGDHVIVVWTGRSDGGARGGLTGRDAALPLLFDVADVLDAPAAGARPIAPPSAPAALKKLEPSGSGPRLIFPPDGSTLQVAGFGESARGLVLAATGKDLAWYVDGQRLAVEPISGRVVWRPKSAGFYRFTVVDGAGREARSRVRVKAG